MTNREITVLSLFLLPAALVGEPMKSGEVTLDLDRGAGADGAMTLTLPLEDGRWGAEVWGRATGHNYGQHPGEVVAKPGAAGEASLAVLLTVTPDTVASGGKAEYAVTVKRQENVFDGRFSGVFCDEPVSGTVHGVMAEPLVRPVSSYRPLEHEEHPRLIFRKADLPELKRRMETPEGKAMAAMLTARAPLRMPGQVTDRHTSWMAANWAAIYCLTGDREAAVEARRVLMEEVIAKPLPLDRDDIQQSPRLLGVALTYDLCYDAWDEAFRRYLAEYIQMTAEDLYRGYLESLPVVADRVDPVPWRCRNAVRVSCAGTAALAVLNDSDSSGKPLHDAARLARAAERDLTEWLRDGVTETGFCVEGPLQKSIALANGVLAFMQADRVALGRDMASVNPMLIAGHALTGRAAEDGSLKLGISSISVQASGRWPMGFAAVPESLRGPMRWLFDRDVGLAGKQHFDCAYPYQAAYALANYPFHAPAKEPGAGMPLFVADMRHGSMVCRNRWQDARDIVVTLDFNAMSLPGLDTKTGPRTGVMRVAGLGGEWVDGILGMKPVNGIFGGEMLYAESGRAGQAAVGARLDPSFRTVAAASARRVEKAPEWGVAPKMRFEPPARPASSDVGIRCTRHVGVDFTGTAGVPAVIAVVDRIASAQGRMWDVAGVRDAAHSGRRFTAGTPAGANLAGHFVAPAGGRGKAEGDYFLVMTLQEGAAPEVKVEGQGLAARVTVGGQTIAFDGQRIVFGK